MNRAVFFDRDGVLNEARVERGVAASPRTAAELRIVADAAESLARLRSVGFILLVVTNQPEVARGGMSPEEVDQLHAVLRTQLPIDGVYFCPHDGGWCVCRKPKPGLILEAASDWDIDLKRSWLIGDRWVDLMTGLSAGVRPVLLEQPHSWRPTSAGSPPEGLKTLPSRPNLSACVDFVLQLTRTAL